MVTRYSIKTMRMLNNVNSIMLCISRITGNSIPHEARPMTTSYNLVRCIRIIRYKFAGSILRSPTLSSGENRLTYLALRSSQTRDQRIREHSHGCPPTLITRKSDSPSNGQSNMECKDRSNPIFTNSSFLSRVNLTY